MKTPLTIGLLWVATFGVEVGGREAHPPTCLISETAPEKGAGPDAGEAPLATVSALLTTLRERGLITESNRQLESRLISALLESVKPVDLAGAEASPVAITLSELQGPWRMPGGAIYLRAVAVGGDFVEKFAVALARMADERAAAVVLDLRHASGSAPATDFTPLSELLAEIGKPCGVLVGQRTLGTAELLAAAMASASNVVLVGQPTAGAPYPNTTLSISERLRVSIPLRPTGDVAGLWPPRPLHPDLLVAKSGGGKFVASGSPPTPNEIERDLALRRTLDMFSMAAAMGLH